MTTTATTTAPIDEVVDLLRQLHLPHMRRHAPDLLATAKAQRWDPAECSSIVMSAASNTSVVSPGGSATTT